ncbi:MAG: hypothetical protein V4448_17555 [Pseudomonadota bacterium]
MNIIQQLQAGIRVPFNETGRFFRILASDLQDKITVQFYRNGALICEAQQVGRGFSETMEDGVFDAFAVTSSVTQNVNIVTRAGSRILYDTPPVGDVNVLSLPPVVIANPDAQKLYMEYASSWKSNVAKGANGVDVIFTPAANVNGAILKSGQVHSSGASFTLPAFIAKTSSPASNIDGDVLSVGIAGWNSGSAICTYINIDREIKIPAGYGLYYIAGVAEGNSHRSVLYTLL